MSPLRVQIYIIPGLFCASLAGNPTGGFNRLFQLNGTRQDSILKAVNAVGTEIGETDPARLALAWVLAHPSGLIPLVGSTQVSRVSALTDGIMDLVAKITPSLWWKIGRAGGLCPLADSECNYSLYRGF
jgi:predicted oxidoreductase